MARNGPGRRPREHRPAGGAAAGRSWLNPIEAKWRHGKRRVVEPARLLSAAELAERVCAAFACPYEPHLTVHDDLDKAA